MHLDTGFVGTPLICIALSQMGYDEYAYNLLLHSDYPSWLYQVELGATTIWERWNSVLPNGRINDTGMNSLNHYAYGSFVEWIYQYACGVKPMVEFPGFKKVKISPHINGRLKFAECELQTVAGTYYVFWKIQSNGDIQMKFKVPFNASAYVTLPDADKCTIMFTARSNYISPEQVDNHVEVELTTGEYEVNYRPTKDYISRLSTEMSTKDLLDNPKDIDILKEYTGEFLENEKEQIKEREDSLEKILKDYHYFKYYNPGVINIISEKIREIEAI